MGLFTKSVSPVDDKLADLIFPRANQARSRYARVQGVVRQAIGQAEEIRLIGVDLDRWGNPVTVVTSERVLVCKRDQIESQAPGPVTDLKIIPAAGSWLNVTGKPNIDVHFLRFEDANAFMIELDARDIPQLYPEFFQGILRATNLPENPTNMSRLIERVARMIVAGGAYSYFGQTQDHDARQNFDRRFKDNLQPQAIATACDDMIDWLWSWRATCHGAIRQLVPEIEILLVSEESPLSKATEEVPPMEW